MLNLFHSRTVQSLSAWLGLLAVVFAVLSSLTPEWFGHLTLPQAILAGVALALIASILLAVALAIGGFGYRKRRPAVAVSDRGIKDDTLKQDDAAYLKMRQYYLDQQKLHIDIDKQNRDIEGLKDFSRQQGRQNYLRSRQPPRIRDPRRKDTEPGRDVRYESDRDLHNMQLKDIKTWGFDMKGLSQELDAAESRARANPEALQVLSMEVWAWHSVDEKTEWYAVKARYETLAKLWEGLDKPSQALKPNWNLID